MRLPETMLLIFPATRASWETGGSGIIPYLLHREVF
jgi:hypothetical protein